MNAARMSEDAAQPSFKSGWQMKAEVSTNCLRRKLGSVYTPDLLSDWVAMELVQRLPDNIQAVIVDPACGDGALLKAVNRVKGTAKLTLLGIDVDRDAIRKAARSLSSRVRFTQADALETLGNFRDQAWGWDSLIQKHALMGVISNPPWGAQLKQTARQLQEKGYQLARGQFDSYELFIELCLRVVPQRTMLAFIVPDSIFLPEHKPVREMLLEQTQLHMIARLGEGFFPGVYRGVAVILCEKRKPRLPRLVECFRLCKRMREKVLCNEISLIAAKHKESHYLPQKSFVEDEEKRFTIDVTRDELSFFDKIRSRRGDWLKWLTSGRGVELSKTGAVLICPACETARPEPRTQGSLQCDNCGTRFSLSTARHKVIVRRSTSIPPGWKPLIVGEDVDRYKCSFSRVIEAAVPGINYKEHSSFEERKLLVRKTGLGIKAAIDDSGALTNQVVFHYTAKTSCTPAFYLDYVLGVLCSRIMLAYHLKQTGESEWRSHPYITQKTISELPVPEIAEGDWEWRQAKAIANAVAKRRKSSSNGAPDDLHIDSLVAGLYGLDNQGCEWVLGVLNDAQSLRPITSMRLQASNLCPMKV
jgi:adenine-specific DNA-methyltransferase